MSSIFPLQIDHEVDSYNYISETTSFFENDYIFDDNKNKQNCKNTQTPQKSLPKNIRLIIYSFLSLNQSYQVIIKLQKTEQQLIPYAKNCRFSQIEQLYINSQYLSDKLNFRYLRNYFQKFVKQIQIDQLLNFFNIIDKQEFEQQPVISIEFNSSQNTENLCINQNLSYSKIKFNKLSIIKTYLTFADQATFPLFNLFPTIHLQESFIGHIFKVDDQILYSKKRQSHEKYLMTPAQQPFLKLRELVMDKCLFIDSRMLASLENLETLKIMSTQFNQLSINVLENIQYMKNLKRFTALGRYNCQFLSHEDSYLYGGRFYEFNPFKKQFQSLQKIKTDRMIYPLECIIENKKFIEYPDACIILRSNQSIILQSLLCNFFAEESRSLIIQAQKVVYFSGDFQQQQNQNGKCIGQMSLIEQLNFYYNRFNIQVCQKQDTNQKDSRIYFEFTKAFDKRVKTLYLQVFKSK